MKILKSFAIIGALAVLTTGCTRIETGEVGLRVDINKQVNTTELVPGSWNQTLVGDVLTFPVKDVNVKLDDMTPVAKDNSTMKDVDAIVIYSLNQSQVAELYNTKSKAFHVRHDGDTYLMFNYIYNAARNAMYKEARKYEALDMGDNRQAMEIAMKEQIQKTLHDEGLDSAINITQVLIRSVVPADIVVESANSLVRSKNEKRQKEVEVETAKLEAQRMQALSSQGAQSIAYIQAQAELNYSQAALQGHINTIIVPRDFKGQVVVNK
jgi:regulator of protease activity HflC (stomatin/prohibitin superfamily)